MCVACGIATHRPEAALGVLPALVTEVVDGPAVGVEPREMGPQLSGEERGRHQEVLVVPPEQVATPAVRADQLLSGAHRPITCTVTRRTLGEQSSTRKMLCQVPRSNRPPVTGRVSLVESSRCRLWAWPLRGSSGGTSRRRARSSCS